MSACRLCGGEGIVRLNLMPTPIANSFPAQPDREAERFPLDLQECEACGHVQLAQIVPVCWSDYHYQTPAAVQPHLMEAARASRLRYPRAERVLEIGSNNGRNLEALESMGLVVLGVDPSATQGIPLPFSHALATQLPKVDLVVANNVLAHVDDLQDVFAGINEVLRPDGALVFEVQYFPKLVERGAFDMIYHEHRDYHNLRTLAQFVRTFGLVLTHYEQLPTHGGSIRVYCERYGEEPLFPEERVEWDNLQQSIDERVIEIEGQTALATFHGPVAAFGATAKATTLLHQCGLTNLIAYVVDETPGKQGRYIPGTAIPIVPVCHMDQHPPAAVLLTAWNYADVITARFPQYHWINPFPNEVPV